MPIDGQDALLGAVVVIVSVCRGGPGEAEHDRRSDAESTKRPGERFRHGHEGPPTARWSKPWTNPMDTSCACSFSCTRSFSFSLADAEKTLLLCVYFCSILANLARISAFMWSIFSCR